MSSLHVETYPDADGNVRLRLPVPGRQRVDVHLRWEPAAVDRPAVFAELRRRGHPHVLEYLARVGEDAVKHPDNLLAYGILAGDPIERPEQGVAEEREPIE